MPSHLVIAGAQRSATSYLYRMLDQHPDVAMAKPLRPEPKYFLRDGISPDAAVYRRELFGDACTAWLGEKSTSYIESPRAAERMASVLPGALLVFVLRDPVERAISNYRFSVMNGLERLPLDQALQVEAERCETPDPRISVSPFAYFRRGLYAGQLEAWYARFPAAQIRLLTTESLVSHTSAVMGSLFERMGVDPGVKLTAMGQQVNASVDAGSASEAVRRRLRQAYHGPNQQLADSYGLDISVWQ